MEKKKAIKMQEANKSETNKPVAVAQEPQSPSLSLDNKILIAGGIGIIILLIATFGTDFPELFSSVSSSTAEGIAATVNGNFITEAEVQEQLTKIPAYYFTSGMDNETIRAAILDQLVAKELLLEKSADLEVIVSDAEIAETIANITLQAQLTAEEFQKRLEEQSITQTELEAMIREQLAVNKVIEQQVLANIQITEEEIQTYYNEQKESLTEVRASHILICYKDALRCEQERTKEEALAQAQELITQLKNGASFEEVAKEYSDDPSAEFNSGDLGWFTQGQMVPEFEEAVFGMNVGQLTDAPVETAYGYHLIKVTDKKQAYEDFREELATQLTVEKQKAAVEAYLEQLKTAASIVYANATT